MPSRVPKRFIPPISKEAAALLPLTAAFAAKRRRVPVEDHDEGVEFVLPPQAHRPTPAFALRRWGAMGPRCERSIAIDETVDAIMDFLPMISSDPSALDSSQEPPETDLEPIDVRRRSRTGGTGRKTPSRGH